MICVSFNIKAELENTLSASISYLQTYIDLQMNKRMLILKK